MSAENRKKYTRGATCLFFFYGVVFGIYSIPAVSGKVLTLDPLLQILILVIIAIPLIVWAILTRNLKSKE